VPIRQFVLTLPFSLRFPLAFDGKLLGQVLRIFIDTVVSNYRKRVADRGIADGESGAVQLDGVYAPGRDGGAPIFHPAPELTQEDVLAIVARASKRILRFLKRRGVISLVTAPGDGEITVVTDETMGEKDPLLARLLAAATAGASPAGPAHKRAPVRIVLDPDATPVAKGKLCGQQAGFNLHAQTKVAANDKKGREHLCKYILRPPLANDRLKILDDGNVRLEFKRPWSDGTSSVDLAPLALIARLAAIIPPPRRHVVRYSGVISSHSSLRSQVVPVPAVAAPEETDKPSLPLSHYISWSRLLKKTFEIDTVCPRCKTPLRLIAMIETEDTIKKILSAMGLPTCAPKLWPARPPPSQSGGGDGDWLN
jgi:hypothetical protein